MYKIIRKVFILIGLFVTIAFVTANIRVKGTTETWVNYEYGNSELYSITNTYNYNGNNIYDMSKRNDELYTENEDTQPILTVLTHGLGGSATNWSLKNGSFTYCEDSLITRLTNIVGGDAYIYKYKVEKGNLTIYDLSVQNERIINGEQSGYLDDSRYNKPRILNISKPIIILFETFHKFASNNDVYADFNYAISKAVYDIKLLNNGVLPKINLIGHSRGGLTNLQYALDHPDLVHSMYSIGTPYLGSTSASIDIDTLQIGGGDIGEEDIINPNIYMDYYNRWNNDWNSLYRNIKVHAIGGYSTTMFLQRIFQTNYAEEKLTGVGCALVISAIERIEELEILHNSNEVLIPDFLYDLVKDEIVQEIGDTFNLEDETRDALENIIFNEIKFDSCYPFLAWHNDGFVDLKSQLGKKTFNNNLLEYKGFNRFEKNLQ